MITLSEAFKLCAIRDEECIKLREASDTSSWASFAPIYTAAQIRKRFDMKRIHVHRISPWFSLYEYEGWMFTVDKLP